jgi:prefoldin subunit 5
MGSAFELTDEYLSITGITVTNRDAIAYVRQIPEGEREATIAKAIEVGLFCLERGRNTQDIDFVKRQVQELLHNVEMAIGGVAGTAETALLGKIGTDNGQVLAPIKALVDASAKVLIGRLEEVKNLLTNDLDPNCATGALGIALSKVRTLLDPKHQDSVQNSISEAVSSVADDDGLLAKTVRKCVEESIKPLTDEVDALSKQLSGEKMVIEALANTPSKGPEFEEEVANTLAAWARISGAHIERVGEDNQPGDFIVDIHDEASGAHSLRVVVEARDRQTPVGRQKIAQDLAPKFRHRKAAAAVYVSKTPSGLAKEIGDWAEGHCDGGAWVACTHDHLTLALRFVAVDQKIKRLREARPDIDGSLIQAQAQAIRASLGRITTIKSKITNLRNTTSDIETEANSLKTEIVSAINALEEALRQEKKGPAGTSVAVTTAKPVLESAAF